MHSPVICFFFPFSNMFWKQSVFSTFQSVLHTAEFVTPPRETFQWLPDPLGIESQLPGGPRAPTCPPPTSLSVSSHPLGEVHFLDLTSSSRASGLYTPHTGIPFALHLAVPAEISGLWLNTFFKWISLTSQGKVGASFASFLPVLFKHLPRFYYYIFMCAFTFIYI